MLSFQGVVSSCLIVTLVSIMFYSLLEWVMMQFDYWPSIYTLYICLTFKRQKEKQKMHVQKTRWYPEFRSFWGLFRRFPNRLSPHRAKLKVATQDAKTLRTGGGYILNSMAKVEAQAFLRELRLWVLFWRNRLKQLKAIEAWWWKVEEPDLMLSWFCW